MRLVVLAIDPGTTQSGWCMFDGQRVHVSGVEDNHGILQRIYRASRDGVDMLALERFEARGMPMSEDSIETVIWTGRFQQQWHSPNSVRLVKRSTVKLRLCGTSRAKDPHVRQAVIDKVGGKGTKAAPGPTHGVSSHAWSALAVALVALGVD